MIKANQGETKTMCNFPIINLNSIQIEGIHEYKYSKYRQIYCSLQIQEE